MGQRDTKSGGRLGTVTVAISIGAVLVGCAAPKQLPLSPVADQNAPMRVSTANVTTALPDPVGRLFNDGPRQIMTYSVNTDPLSVLFRDPAFIVKLSPTVEAEPVQVVTAQTGRNATELWMNETRDESNTSQPSPLTPALEFAASEAIAASTGSMATATTTTTADPETDPEPTLATEKTTAPSTNTMAAATTPVAVAAATATAATSVPAKPSARDTVLTNDPVVLDGLKQKTAGWPIATKPSNVFGAKGPDGTAWRGLVYKSPAKTPVKAIDPGTVVFAQPMRGYGNVIIIDHGKNYTSIYGYNEALTKKVGDYVRKGETVALVGDSGPLADEALYFEIRKGTLPIDPTIYLATNP